jgi:hypothetical protein
MSEIFINLSCIKLNTCLLRTQKLALRRFTLDRFFCVIIWLWCCSCRLLLWTLFFLFIACPASLTLPAITRTVACYIPDYCTGVSCCVEVPLIGRSFLVSVFVDGCDMKLNLWIEKRSVSISLIGYSWGKFYWIYCLILDGGVSWPWSYGSWIYNYLATGRLFSPGTAVSSTNKTDHHDITEILLKVALNTINQTKLPILDG